MDNECWMMKALWCLIYCIGCYHLAKFVFALGWSLVRWMTRKVDVRKKYGGEGCWAVVTGGTDGIGLGFVEVLVEDGWNVCIISRNEQKINTLINRMNRLNPKVSCLAVTADFKRSSQPQFMPNIINKIKHLDIGLVINNVGTSYLQPLLQNTISQCIDIVNVNCISMAAFTCAILPHLKKRQKRSGIINLSSFICAVPTPYTSLYSGTKAFNHWFSLCLSEQFATHQIDVLSVKPMYVESPLSKEKAGGTVATREQFARAALKELYLGVRESQGWILHRILASIIAIIPPPIARLIANTIVNSKIKWFNKKD